MVFCAVTSLLNEGSKYRPKTGDTIYLRVLNELKASPVSAEGCYGSCLYAKLHCKARTQTDISGTEEWRVTFMGAERYARADKLILYGKQIIFPSCVRAVGPDTQLVVQDKVQIKC